MSIWTRISDALAALTSGESLATVFETLRAPPERSVAFTIAVIALAAKMAKADGQVSRAEVAAFREVFHIAPEDEPGAARVFNLARQDVAGFEDYAARIAAMFRGDKTVLCDLMEGLFHIALADGTYHPKEDAFRRAWRALVRDSHPDRMIARGLPEEAVKMSEKRLIAINRAWAEISEKHAA